ncbi:hypothetical protein ACFVWY_29320 [Streptomyces sp. NPDC058195]|uniref:hypothetical protein n=1 Tax=Streptomyces sp. NPDC058195 TaxID=3346375 RepID=UPI0036EE1B37
MSEVHPVEAVALKLEELTGSVPTRQLIHGIARLEFPVTAAAVSCWERILEQVLDHGEQYGLSDIPAGPIAWLTMAAAPRITP